MQGQRTYVELWISDARVHPIPTSDGLSGINPQPVLAQKARAGRWGSVEVEGGLPRGK